MVKKNTSTSNSEDEVASEVTNENGKRPGVTENKESRKRFKTKSLYRQPTVNELNRLQETENLFNSNLFRLQVEEVLQEVKLKEKTEKKFQQWFSDLKNHLDSIPVDTNEYDLTEPTLAKRLKVKLPISEKLEKIKCVFKFHKFTGIDIVGSYALNCAINSKLRIDLQITVPAETYTKNDSINYRYHKKRAAYLAYIASYLKKYQSIQELKYTWLNGYQTQPVLDITPSGKLANHFSVRLRLSCESEAYKMHRFSPSRNNLRETWIFGSESLENNEGGSPTPHYNSTVLSDLTSSLNHEFLKGVLANSENLKQAIVSLKIWLRQRNLRVSGHVVSLFVAYLVQVKRINNIMSSYQIVRNVWIAWKTSEWDTKGISLHKESDSPPISEFQSYFPVVFLDVTGYYNVCWNMCKGTYESLKRECSLAVDMLDNPNINSFIPLFMVPVKPLMLFDHILRFKNLSKLKEKILSVTPKEARVNYGVDETHLIVETIHTLLSKGLDDRVELILEMVETDFSWSVKKTPEKAKKDGYEERLSFGFIMNSENAMNVIEKGPPANLPEAEEFRSFWGEKSELRRFQDGSITETCVWEGDCISDRRGVNRQIIDYLMHFKYDIPSSELYHIYDQLDSLSVRKQCSAPCEETCMEVVRVFDDLRRDLRSLTQLPLEISAVYGVSPVFSYSDPVPPIPQAKVRKPWRRGDASLIKDIVNDDGNTTCLPHYVKVTKAVLELGHSGKWPGDLEAFRCLKAAFHYQIAERLNKQFSLPTQAYFTHIDVLKQGLIYRLEIAHPKEITLLMRELNNGVVKYRDTEESINLLRDTALLPRLRGALNGLQHTYSAYGPTVCLLKRWLSGQLLSFPSVVSELLTAAVFIQSPPVMPPNTPTSGLYRVLHLLANTDWRTNMITLNFNDQMSREDIAEIERKFNERTEGQPYMFIVTAYDGDSPSVFTLDGPTEQLVIRSQILARSALKYFEDALLRDMKDNLLAAFIPSLSGYDVIINLHTSLVPHYSERIDQPAVDRGLPSEVADDVIPVVEFDVIQKYLTELRSAYSEFALFFHDVYGGDFIAVLWKPHVKDVRELQISNATALCPFEQNGELKYKVNIDAIIEDFKIIGAGLVRDITVCN